MTHEATAPRGGQSALLGLAALAVAFAAADTYVVVLALPDMMASASIPLNELQRAAPIVSGFLLGYVAMLPLIGRIADLRGRVPVLVASLVVFALGSLITALAFDLPSMVAGRFLQGVGGGGLVPATLALVADIYPAERRGVPLGVVSAVQEFGSVIGPLFGAVVLAVADWRAIFAINLAVGLVLAAAIRGLAGTPGQDRATDTAGDHPGSDEPAGPRGRPDLIGGVLLLLTLTALGLLLVRPASLQRDLTWGELFVSFTGQGRWLTPLGVIVAAGAVLFLARCLTARRPLVDVRGWSRSLVEADLVGALLLGIALSGVILAFATADPEIQVFSDQGWWYLLGTAVATGVFVWHLRRTERPLVPRDALAARPAWGSLLVSFFVGAALIAALIDIPIFARTTIYPDSQLMAALVLVRFLVALPVGAVVGGYLTRTRSAGAVTLAGMLLAAVGFVWMAQWDGDALRHWSATVPLVIGGFGFGLALAPVNAACLAATEDAVHGLASAFVVVARMVGMLVGISALTTIGLRFFFAEVREHGKVSDICDGDSRCAAYREVVRDAALLQEHVVFLGAAGCAVIAGLLALWLFRGAATRGVSTGDLLRSGG